MVTSQSLTYGIMVSLMVSQKVHIPLTTEVQQIPTRRSQSHPEERHKELLEETEAQRVKWPVKVQQMISLSLKLSIVTPSLALHPGPHFSAVLYTTRSHSKVHRK